MSEGYLTMERQSVAIATKHVISLPIDLPIKRALLNTCLWKLTEAGGKYKTRYRSEGALASGKPKLRHEHVFRRASMIDRLLAASDQADEILREAVGCTVTIDEHDRLNEVDRLFPDLDGWDRYLRAGIVVHDIGEASS